MPTALYYLRRPALAPSPKPALFTMNILPPMMTVWHHLARKYLGDAVDIVIFDCSGMLDPRTFRGSTVQKFLNLYAATKSDEFLYHIARHRRIGWLCDDDVFFVREGALDCIEQELSVPGTAMVSMRPRSWWHFDIDGRCIEPSGSYCLAINRDIVVEREHLSMRPCEGNTHPSHIGKGTRRYDTADRANELLLRRGYRCAIASADDQQSIAAFSGMSGAVILLWHFRSPQETLDYLLAPPPSAWSGNMLFGILSSLLAICTVQECYARLTGESYPLPSLPGRAFLEKVRRDRTPYLRSGQSFHWIDDVSERLRSAL